MLNTTNFDFNQRYTIMHGTAFLATADTLDEVDSYRAGEDDITNHFMKIGDNKDNKIISGCMYSWWKRHPAEYADSWRKW
jgi:hypothetical protein